MIVDCFNAYDAVVNALLDNDKAAYDKNVGTMEKKCDAADKYLD